MHELRICCDLLKIIEAKIDTENIASISTIWLDIGILAGVDFNAIEFSFPIAAKGSKAENAKLIINKIPGVAYCQLCQKKFSLNHYLTPCPDCSCYNYTLEHGKEMNITKIGVK